MAIEVRIPTTDSATTAPLGVVVDRQRVQTAFGLRKGKHRLRRNLWRVKHGELQSNGDRKCRHGSTLPRISGSTGRGAHGCRRMVAKNTRMVVCSIDAKQHADFW